MVGLIIVGLAVVAVVVLVLFSYWKPGPDENELGPPEGANL
ncbi:MAG: hypothetical protein JWO38_1724 [Gemmataceae bacterium]|nr:hypothetical protein [Gemmataceae bacterium]